MLGFFRFLGLFTFFGICLNLLYVVLSKALATGFVSLDMGEWVFLAINSLFFGMTCHQLIKSKEDTEDGDDS